MTLLGDDSAKEGFVLGTWLLRVGDGESARHDKDEEEWKL